MQQREEVRTLPKAGERPTPSGRVHIVVVDDEAPVLRAVKEHLATAELGGDIRIHYLESCDDAVAVAELAAESGERVACALVDLNLGAGVDGIETTLSLWRLDPEVQCTLVTGSGTISEQRIRDRIGSRFLDRLDFVTKPFTRFEIVQRVRRALGHWRGRQMEQVQRARILQLVEEVARNNHQLERMVEQRTQALADQNIQLEAKNQELQDAMRELEAAQTALLHQEKMACIGQLAAGVAHELNNPIGFVYSNLNTLGRYCSKIRELLDHCEERLAGEEPFVERKKELKIDRVLEDLPLLLDESLQGAERIRKIVLDLKEFSHPAERVARYADLNEDIRSTLNIVRNEIKYKARTVLELGELPPVRCRHGQINQVFLNLLVNAAQAIDEQGEIRIESRRDGDHAVVSVSDTGSGIEPETIARIFDPFFTTKEVGEGTGLGLSISYDIVRKHGGTIEVQSEVGVGTTFTVRLPIEGLGEEQDGEQT